MSSAGSPAESLRRKILALPGIIEKAHRVSPHAYYVGGREIAHFHGPNQIDIRLTQVAQAEALTRGLAEPHAHAAGAGWVTCRCGCSSSRPGPSSPSSPSRRWRTRMRPQRRRATDRQSTRRHPTPDETWDL